MEALMKIPYSSRVSSSSSYPISLRQNHRLAGNGLDSCFWRAGKVSNSGILSSVFFKQSIAVRSVSRVSPETQLDLKNVDVETEEMYQSKTVRVRFQLEKECLFGQHFFLVGNDPMFGLWDPKTAVPLNWSDRHVWFVELDIPIGKLVKYKFVLKDETGEILWQPDPDRVFEAWETENTIVVSEDWENAELQVKSESEEQENIFLDDVSLSNQLLEELSAKQSMEDPVHGLPRAIVEDRPTSSKRETFVDTISGDNGRANTIDLVDYEGEPVLVPGLPPILEASPARIEIEAGSTGENYEHDPAEKIGVWLDDTVEVFEAHHNLSMTEELKQEVPNIVLSKEVETRDEMAYNEEEKIQCKNETYDVLLNDLQWGHKTLQKLITNFKLF